MVKGICPRYRGNGGLAHFPPRGMNAGAQAGCGQLKSSGRKLIKDLQRHTRPGAGYADCSA